MTDDAGKLILRLTVGVLMLMHGIAKIRYGIGGIEGMLEARGLPGVIAWGIYVGEVLAPLMVIAGFYARIGGLVMALSMVVAIALAHSTQLFDIAKNGGWALELQAFFLLTSLVVAMIGPGRYAINRN